MRKPRLTRLLLRKLTDVQRKILWMHVAQGKSFRQIQSELRYKSVSTVYQHYRYGLAKARAQTKPEAAPPAESAS